MTFYPFVPTSAAGVQPWQFQPETYGAKGNGKVISDVTTNGTSVVTSPTIGAEGSAAVGKYIMIHGANGSTNGPYIGTITAVSGNNVTVSGTAPIGSVSNCPAVYGTDDTAAINAALAAAGAYATANNYLGEVVFGAKTYILGTGPTQASSPVTQNSQLVLPYPNANGTTQKMVIALTGAGDAGHTQYFESVIPNLAGTCLVTMLAPTATTINNNAPTFGLQSVVGGPSGSGGLTGGFANIKAVVKGISVWCPIYTNLIAWDFAYCSAMRVQQSSAHIFAPTGVNVAAVGPYLNVITAVPFTSSLGHGWRTPVTGNNDDIVMDDVTAQGYENGFEIFDHFTAGRLAAIYSDVAVFWNASLGTSGTMHGLFIQSMSAEAYNGGFRVNGSGGAQVDINWDSENSGAPVYDVSDGSNALFGLFRFGDKIDNRVPVVSGASNLKVINDNQSAGHMASPPAVPATTVTAVLVYRDATVVVHTGAGVTVSAITVDGTATSQTVAAASSSVPVRVPAGKTIALTYAGGTPTWDWWLD